MKIAPLVFPIVFLTAAAPLSAQLTQQQKVLDFQVLASIYAKRYAPANWKKQLNGTDIFDIAPWLQRVRNSKDDLEYYETAAQYVAQLDDLHSSFITPTNFFADSGIVVDIYDGKVLIESINRRLLPAADYPFAVGDELVSVDGKPVETLITEFSRQRRRGNPSTTRRSAADLLTFRPQSVLPRTVELGDSAVMVIRSAAGLQETYTIPWVKTNIPLTKIGPVPDPRVTAAVQDTPDDYMAPFRELTNFAVRSDDHLLRGETYNAETGRSDSRRYLLGWGSRNPSFILPASFQQRLGRVGADFHYSGVYQSEGMRIGYIRFPNFAPPNYVGALNELANEITFLKQNTDGLVVDVMRNTGGGCYMLDAAAFLIPRQFWFFGEEIRVTRERIASIDFAMQQARLRNADDWIIRYYQTVLDELQRAYAANRGLTDSLPACPGLTQPFQIATFDNMPATDRAGNNAAYDKPLIVLVDEFSTSAGDIFPAMLQDNGRGPLVGTRTNGAGGSTSGWPAGMYSEAVASNTNSLVVRRQPVSIAGYPQASYIENIGAHADIPLEFMTRENLMQRGQPFVEAFTKILVERIRSGAN